jgi:hypothetical protein
LDQIEHTNISLASLNTSDVRAVKSGSVGQLLLGDASRVSELSDIHSELFQVRIH